MNSILLGLFSLVGVIVGACLTLIMEIYKDKRNRKRDTNYLVVRVICTFDQFFDGCASVVFDNCVDSCGESGITVSLPKLDLDSLDVNWSSIELTEMCEIFSFPSLVKTADETLKNTGEHAFDFDEYFQERQYQYSIIALKVDSLTTKLRKAYKMPPKNRDCILTELFDIKKKIEHTRKNA